MPPPPLPPGGPQIPFPIPTHSLAVVLHGQGISPQLRPSIPNPLVMPHLVLPSLSFLHSLASRWWSRQHRLPLPLVILAGCASDAPPLHFMWLFVVMVVVCVGTVFCRAHLPYPILSMLFAVTSRCLHCEVTIQVSPAIGPSERRSGAWPCNTQGDCFTRKDIIMVIYDAPRKKKLMELHFLHACHFYGYRNINMSQNDFMYRHSSLNW